MRFGGGHQTSSRLTSAFRRCFLKILENLSKLSAILAGLLMTAITLFMPL
jgi:hypothetical protein